MKAALGPAKAFAHGGRYWGYWPLGSSSGQDMGILIKFGQSGVEEVVIHQDWSKLSTEMALSGMDGLADPVDGSDGYKDLRDWAEGTSE